MLKLNLKNKFNFNFDYFLTPLVIIGLSYHFLFRPAAGPGHWFIVLVAVAGLGPVLVSVYRACRERKITVDLLASIALIFSYLSIDWGSALFINLMLASARLFSLYTEGEARRSLASLFKLRPDTARVKEGDQIVEKKIAEIKVGDLILVELGERLPVDGVVVSGAGTLDQSALTGESLPVEKKEGDLVLSATLLIAGNLIVQAKRVGKDTSLERTIALVAQSQQNKAPISRLADKFAAAYILLVGIGAILLWLLTQDTRLVLAVLLVVCADDIAVAIPLAFLSATSYAARRGVIIKGGNFLEGLNQLKTVVLDKTGTLTLGRLVVERAVLSVGVSENELLTAGALTCAMSSHPTAKAVIKYAKQFGIEPVIPERYEERLGRGMIVDYRGERYAAGRPVFLADLNLLADEAAVTAITAAENQGFSVTIVSRGENLLGYFILADEVKPGLRPIMQDLHSLGVGRIVMLTGDNERVAARVAAGAGIDTYHAGLLPEQKVDYVKKYLNKESKVAMVGDGVNDAAALALADIGVAMGEIGSDQAIESADLVLAKDDLHKLPEMIRLSRLLMRVVKQDFVIWGVSNAVGLTLVFMRILPPEGAAAFNFLTDFFPLINSLRLFRLHLGRRGL